MRTSAGRPYRRTRRLQDFTYRGASYSITLCSWLHQCVYGRVDDYSVSLSRLGEIVKREWLKTPEVRPGVILDVFEVMPNHMHAILFVPPLSSDFQTRMKIWSKPPRSPFVRQRRSLSSLVSGFKGAVTRAARDELSIGPVWQDNFDEHVIRGPMDLARIQRYIVENPANWTADRYHPSRLS